MTNSRHLRWVLAFCALAALWGCNNNRTRVKPRSFEQPSDVAFACFDSASGLFVDGSQCAVTVSTDSSSPLRWTAFVPQTSRGVLATVDLENDRNSGVIDLNQQVPGFTFFVVDEIPYAVVTVPSRPQWVYVANFGSQTVQAVPTSLLRRDAAPTAQQVEEVEIGAGPTSMRATPDGAFLLATIPRRGSLLQIALRDDGGLGSTQEIPLPIPAALPTPLVANQRDSTFQRVCPENAPLAYAANVDEVNLPPPRVIGSASNDDGTAAASLPVSLSIDAERGIVLVSDTRYPVLHTLRIDAQGVVPGSYVAVATGAPLTQTTLTPLLPVALGSNDAVRRFLYGIDAIDESVMAIDASDDNPALWTLLLVSSGSNRPDRLPLRSGARVIEVVTPEYPGGAYCDPASSDSGNAIANRLRGAFLSIGLDDGTVVIVDAFDLDATCRGGAACQSVGSGVESKVYIRAHDPRIATQIRDDIGVASTPQMYFNGSPFRVNVDGSVTADLAPTLAPLAGCPFPTTMSSIYPATADNVTPLICAVADPWTARNQSWVAAYQGPLPGTADGRARVLASPVIDGVSRPGNWLVDTVARFCTRGVLGASDVPGGSEPESGYVGDRVVITSELSPEALLRQECVDLVEDALGATRTVALPVLQAYQTALQLGARTLDEPSATVDLVKSCFAGLLGYVVQTQKAYTVVGSTDGFIHRVVAQTDGRCAIDPKQPILASRFDSYRNGRAQAGKAYQNPSIAFRILHSPATDDSLATGSTAQLLFSLERVPSSLFIDPSSAQTERPVLPAALRYNAISGKLYLVDATSRGLIELELDTFGTFRVFE